jgi:hypothetical protein
MEEQLKEYNELIATRVVGEGDTWQLVNSEVKHSSLTDALEAWFEVNQENVEFRLAPLDSKLYVIRSKKVQVPPPKKYNLYGDPC